MEIPEMVVVVNYVCVTLKTLL